MSAWRNRIDLMAEAMKENDISWKLLTPEQKRFLAVLYPKYPHDGNNPLRWQGHAAEMDLTEKEVAQIYRQLTEMNAITMSPAPYVWWTEKGREWARECHRAQTRQQRRRATKRDLFMLAVGAVLGGAISLLVVWIAHKSGLNQ